MHISNRINIHNSLFHSLYVNESQYTNEHPQTERERERDFNKNLFFARINLAI